MFYFGNAALLKCYVCSIIQILCADLPLCSVGSEIQGVNLNKC